MDEPKNIAEAIARIMGELPAIGKDHTASAQQGGYAYRGIEEVTTKAQALCSKYGVVFFPQAEITEVRDLLVNSKPWTDTYLSVTYEVVHGPSDTRQVVKVPGIGRDNADKGSNKAMTQAFKYALIQTFMISDAKDDTDGVSTEADAPPEPVGMTRETGDRIVAAFDAIGITEKDVRQRYIAAVVGREDASARTISEHEARQVLTALELDAAADRRVPETRSCVTCGVTATGHSSEGEPYCSEHLPF